MPAKQLYYEKMQSLDEESKKGVIYTNGKENMGKSRNYEEGN